MTKHNPRTYLYQDGWSAQEEKGRKERRKGTKQPKLKNDPVPISKKNHKDEKGQEMEGKHKRDVSK